MDISEPKITRDKVLFLDDDYFNPDNVCIVSGCGTGIGRATAVAAADDKLTVVGFVKTPLALNQIPAQTEQRGISQEALVRGT
jgi:NAD(P)-dependent dehydrogenase (short-subunit alcohol dehydrogenase family)